MLDKHDITSHGDSAQPPASPAMARPVSGSGNRESRRFMVLSVVLVIFVSALALAYRPNLGRPERPADGAARRLVTDMYGREVRVPAEIEHLAAIGPQALRLVSYLGCGDLIVATENREGPNFNAKSYMYANPHYAEVNVLANSALTDMERILALDPRPDLVIMGEATFSWQPQLDLLETAGIPVVGIQDMQDFGGLFDEQLRLLGQVLGREERAEELLAYISAALADLSRRTADIPEEEKPTVYVAATAWSGMRPFEFSTSSYVPFELVGARNVITPEMTGAAGSPVGFELELIAALDPEFVFVEATGIVNVRGAYNSDKRPVFAGMRAFSGGDQQSWNVYMCLPVIWYFTNFDNMLAGAYHIGAVLYPERFSDLDIAEKTGEIYRHFVGRPVFEEMQRWFEQDRGCRLAGRAKL